MSKRKVDYDKLDKILQDADNASRQSGNGVWVTVVGHPDGGFWVTDSARLDTLRQSVDDIEKYLRS